MAVYALGDIQGCYQTFQKLLDRIGFNPSDDRLWLTGDLVNRGPRSLDVLRWAYRHRDSLVTVLGNHDLKLLACAVSAAPVKPRDTFQDVLEAHDRDELLDWLRRRPLVHCEDRFVLVHAGLLPSWTLDEAGRFAEELQAALAGPDYAETLRALYADAAVAWEDEMTGVQRYRGLADIFTRMRLCTLAGRPDYGYTGPPGDAPDGLVPWFSVPNRRTTEQTILFGHWAALGFHRSPGIVALDSGCVWGGALSAVRLPDLKLFQEPLAD